MSTQIRQIHSLIRFEANSDPEVILDKLRGRVVPFQAHYSKEQGISYLKISVFGWTIVWDLGPGVKSLELTGLGSSIPVTEISFGENLSIFGLKKIELVRKDGDLELKKSGQEDLETEVIISFPAFRLPGKKDD